MATRWGIASAGKISHDFVTALGTLPAEEHTVVAVAARDLSRAKDFAKLHNAKKAYGSYTDLANDPEIEVVYVGTVAPQHLKVAKLMLSNGKHVLCEKPLTLNLKQTTELINFAKKKGLFLMEAIWSRSFPIYDLIKEELDSGCLGDVKEVIVSFGVAAVKDDTVEKQNRARGTIGELGVYPIQLATLVYNSERPVSIKASGHLDADGIDHSISATLLYKNGRTATIVTHDVVQLPNEAYIIGTKAKLKIPNFWCPTQIILSSGDVKSIVLPESKIPFNFINSAGLRFEAMEVRRCLKAGLKESPRVSHEDSFIIAEIEDEIRRQLGVVYGED